MTAQAPAGGRPWRYLVVTDTSDDAEYERRVREAGTGVYLTRTVPGLSVEEFAHPDGTWQRGDRLARMRLRGEMFWTHDLTPDDARGIAARWRAAGKLAAAPPVDVLLPADLAARQADRETIDERARRLRAAPPDADDPLDRADLLGVLDGPADVSRTWLAGGGRVAVPAFAAWPVADDSARQVAAALRGLSDTVWVSLVDDGECIVAEGAPTRVAVPAEWRWLRAADDALGLSRPRLLTTPDREVVLLGGADYDVVAGLPEVVEGVLGHDLATARRGFATYVRGEGYFPPRRDLRAVLERYVPPEDRPTGAESPSARP